MKVTEQMILDMRTVLRDLRTYLLDLYASDQEYKGSVEEELVDRITEVLGDGKGGK